MKRISTHIKLLLCLILCLFLVYCASKRSGKISLDLVSQNFLDYVKPLGPGWKTGCKGYGGQADGTWSYALGGHTSWSDYRVDCLLHMVKPANRQDGMEIGAFVFYYALANLGGYEAAIIVRHESPEKHYRVAVSSLWKEIILWRPTGGVVQIQPYSFEVGKIYALSVACQGPQIIVSVDGQEVINWWDTADPVLEGQVGLARKEGESYFHSVKVRGLPRQKQSPPPHCPRFREFTWHNYRWFLDGKEPIFFIRDNNNLDNVKFLPGYRPVMYIYNFITDWHRFFPDKLTDLKVAERGDRLVIDTISVDPKTKSNIKCITHLVVSYDPTTGMYIYDQDCSVNLDAEESNKVGNAWDQGDATLLGGVGSAQTQDPKAFRALYQWSVLQANDGKYYKIPLNHNRPWRKGLQINPDGGVWVAVGDPVLSPVVRMRGLSERFSELECGHCRWAYDMHTMFHPKLVGNKVQPGKYLSKVRYTGMRASKAAKLLSGAAFYNTADLSVKIPVYTAGVGFIERFNKEVLLATPHPEYRIWGGVIDGTVGYDDKCSLRLDGPTEAWTNTGPSYFMSGYGKKNLITAWIKTENVQGEGLSIGFQLMDNTYEEFHPSGITGTKDWTKMEFMTTGPLDHWGVTLIFRNSGTGTVWIDNFKIEALPENKTEDKVPGHSKLQEWQ